MKILFCGNSLPSGVEEKLKHISLAGNRFQNNMVIAFETLGMRCQRINYISIPLECVSKETLLSHDEYHVIVKEKASMSFFRFRRQLKDMVKKNDIIIAYNISYAWLALPMIAKKYGKKSLIILADYSETKDYKSIIGKIYSKLQIHDMRRYDYVVGLSDNIAKKMGNRGEFLRIEGGIDCCSFEQIPRPQIMENEKIKIMYAGLHGRVTGIDILLDAFNMLHGDAELYITGQEGDLTDLIKERVKINKDIHYLGKLSYDEYIQLLGQANILINPRNMNMSENQNNFPSKILEYIAVGRVVVSTKFIGYERFQKTCIFTESDAVSLAEKIRFAISNYEKIASKTYDENREFIKQFSWEYQVKKICGVINGDRAEE